MPRRGKLRGDGTGNNRLSFSHHRRPKKLKRRLESAIRRALTPVSTNTINQLAQFIAPTGGQAWYTVAAGDPQMIGNIFAAVDAASRQDVLGNASGTAVSAGEPFNMKLNVGNFRLKVEYLNGNNALHNLTLYECIARHDVPDTFTSIGNMVTTGFANEYIGSAPTNAATAGSVGVTLFENPLFCSYFKILSVKKLSIAPGNTFYASLSENKPRVVNPLVYNNSDLIAVSGYTRVFVFCVHGSLIVDSTGSYPSRGMSTCQTQAELKITTSCDYNSIAPSLGIKTYSQYGFSTITPLAQSGMNAKTGQPSALQGLLGPPS